MKKWIKQILIVRDSEKVRASPKILHIINYNIIAKQIVTLMFVLSAKRLQMALDLRIRASYWLQLGYLFNIEKIA